MRSEAYIIYTDTFLFDKVVSYSTCFRIIPIMFFTWMNFSILMAQSRSYSTLPMVDGVPGRFEDNQKIKNSPEYFQALAIYEDLVQTRGDYRLPVPGFSLTNSKRKVAFIEYDGPDIVIEKKALDVCNSFGDQKDAAIAFLLGHELTHYYEKHGWRRAFVYDFKDLPVAMKLSQIHDDVYHETEADYLGGFLVYSAGYGLFEKSSDLIEKLYQAYGLPDTLPGYPSLYDRKILSQRSADKMKTLVDVFDQANLLNAIGKYREAMSFYKFILGEFNSREIYNNLGVAATHYAMDLLGKDSLRFQFSASLDLESSIQSRGESNDSLVKQLLHESILYFDAAISLDGHYVPAYYNKALAYALLKDYARSRFYAEHEARDRITSSKYENSASDLDLLSALLDALEGNIVSAKIKLSELAKQGNQLAWVNLQILENKKIPPSTKKSSKSLVLNKYDMNKIVSEFLQDGSLPFDSLTSLPLDAYTQFYNDKACSPGLSAFLITSEKTNSNLFFFGEKVQESTSFKERTREDVLTSFGNPDKIVITPNGQLYVYPNDSPKTEVLDQGMLFEINHKGMLKKKYIYCEFKNN